ncbi:hypothetical protein D9V32_13980 [Mycetocola tolaasinivorans]|uniref:Uncharacterized protein n=1 Tax=Mycetocola tolaasinivorans TaxID=76635 RepID=A0A3L7A2D2_9MICO|nr:hypothetical protein [Mycetocola tolaasinivorans]RLP74145.1 hypothetical protein D9V32_13980 [Mycetocola tolaasinivorans]
MPTFIARHKVAAIVTASAIVLAGVGIGVFLSVDNHNRGQYEAAVAEFESANALILKKTSALTDSESRALAVRGGSSAARLASQRVLEAGDGTFFAEDARQKLVEAQEAFDSAVERAGEPSADVSTDAITAPTSTTEEAGAALVTVNARIKKIDNTIAANEAINDAHVEARSALTTATRAVVITARERGDAILSDTTAASDTARATLSDAISTAESAEGEFGEVAERYVAAARDAIAQHGAALGVAGGQASLGGGASTPAAGGGSAPAGAGSKPSSVDTRPAAGGGSGSGSPGGGSAGKGNTGGTGNTGGSVAPPATDGNTGGGAAVPPPAAKPSASQIASKLAGDFGARVGAGGSCLAINSGTVSENSTFGPNRTPTAPNYLAVTVSGGGGSYSVQWYICQG